MTHLTRRRVSDLVDGHLTPAETEMAWAHVHTCHLCRDEVEREGWVKTQLSSLSSERAPGGCAPDHLKGALLGMPPGDCFLGRPQDDLLAHDERPRRGVGGMAGIAALGGGAAGAAVMGILALGPAPANLPPPDRWQQQPVTQFTPRPTSPPVPVRLDR